MIDKKEKKRSILKLRIRELAEEIKGHRRNNGPYSFADFSEDLKWACADEEIEYDAELISEVIMQLCKPVLSF